MPKRPVGKRSVDASGRTQVRGKAANGEGSVYYAADGRWRATYRVPGEGRPRTASGATREKAIANRDRKLAELASNGSALSVDRTTTIGELAVWWLNEIQKHQVRPTTWAKSKERVRRIVETLGDRPLGDLRAEHVVAWQSEMLTTLAPKTVSHHRQTLAQVVDQAVELGVVPANVVRRVKAPKIPPSSGRALPVADVHALLAAARYDRYGAAVALLFLQGWRVSEALGLAWEDLDLDNAVARVRRACVYVNGEGSQLGPTKTAGVMGDHTLTPTVVEMLRTRRLQQGEEQRRCPEPWPTHRDHGQVVHPAFTTPTGQLVLRQSVTKSVTRAATAAGISTERLGTHTGRRSVVTALYAAGGESIEEIARYVGHASPATTAGYVRDLGNRPAALAERAANLLDPAVRDVSAS
jgi:integrase